MPCEAWHTVILRDEFTVLGTDKHVPLAWIRPAVHCVVVAMLLLSLLLLGSSALTLSACVLYLLLKIDNQRVHMNDATYSPFFSGWGVCGTTGMWHVLRV